jgi:hypothetical protein
MRCTLICAALVAAAWPGARAFGNVYPTNLAQSGATINPTAGGTLTLSYLLNEDATSVNVDILDASSNVVRTINAGIQTKGPQSVVWDGKDNASLNLANGNYSFRVNSNGASRSSWTLTSTDGTLNNFELPRGVAVNNNPTSPYYGRVYVSNGQNLPTANGRAMGDGVYMLNADFSDAGISGGTGPHAGGVDWAPGGSVSPFRLEVGPDDSVYITDWSDGHSGLWQAGPNIGTAVEVLDSTGRDGDGGNVTHGSISDVIVSGLGASRSILTTEEDVAPFNVLRYDIGNAATFTGPPSGVLFDNAGGVIINSLNSIAKAKDGTYWMSQSRAAGTDQASLIQFDASGAILFNSLTSLGNPDPLRNIQGIAYDPVNNLLALATANAGGIHIFDPTTKTIVTTFAFGGGATNTDVAFDNVGNLYVTNRSAEFARIWSPPNTAGLAANSFSTSSLGPVGAISVVPEPMTAGGMLVGAMGLIVASRRARRRNLGS